MHRDIRHHLDWNFGEINLKLDKIMEILRVVLYRERQMSVELDALTAEVDRAVTVEQGTATLLAWVVAELEASKTDPAAIQALADKLKGGTQVLSDAVANVPAADQPPVA